MIKKMELKSFMIKMAYNYKDDKRNGIEKYYNENGKLTFETIYKDDKRNGIEKHYNENGILYSETMYSNDEKHGFQKTFAEDGSLVSSSNYKNGRPQFNSFIDSKKDDGVKKQIISWYYEEIL
ncbi:hypothetical protein DZA35_01545 [Arcobacter sp. HD9-500m-PIT-SAG03]|nr:hypothetical protein DZA35_01545 [Arcobacter sp. HD9-500m-PIT-SAG03]